MSPKAVKKTAAPVPDAADETGEAQGALKAEATDALQTVEYDGVTYTIAAEAEDDLELVEALADLDATGNRLVLPKIVEALIGAEQYAAFKEHYRDEKTGRIPFTALRDLFWRIDTALGE